MSAPISKPMLFSSEMIRALLDGRKTQTRRIAKEFHTEAYGMGWCEKVWQDERLGFFGEWNWRNPTTKKKTSITSITPRHPVGSLIWVKETYRTLYDPATCLEGARTIDYRADGNKRIDDMRPKGRTAKYPWKPSIFMPKSASRITLEVTAVKVERLNDISEEDAKAEGCILSQRCEGLGSADWPEFPNSYRQAYEALWESINGKGSWALNPWVWCYTFRRVKP